MVERVPLFWDSQKVGTLSLWPEGLYACWRGEYRLDKPEVLRLFAVGERGELRLGTPEPRNGVFLLTRRLPAREAAGIGGLLRGELRRSDEEHWQATDASESLTADPEMRRQLTGCSGALTCRMGERRLLALPFSTESPFPLPGLFCFAAIRAVNGQRYAVFCFDKTGNPVFPEKI